MYNVQEVLAIVKKNIGNNQVTEKNDHGTPSRLFIKAMNAEQKYN